MASAEPRAWPQSLRTAHRLLDDLIDRGLRELVLCPGSRSAPVAYAAEALAAAGRLRLHVRVDERGASFLALGLAKGWLHADDEPTLRVAVATTSGTAVANLHPALLEASHSQVPLLALTSDRPASLRGTGANQTTWQPGMFQLVRAAFDVPTRAQASGSLTERASGAAAGRGLAPDGAPWPGPVHLNVCLAEPLAPLESGTSAATQPLDPGEGTEYALPGIPPVATTPWRAGRRRPVGLADPPTGRRGVVVAGDGAGPVAAEFAVACGYPLLAEPSSGARWGNAIPAYQWLLAGDLDGQVDEVVVFGHPTLSRPISRLLARADVPITVVTQGADWTDVAGRARPAYRIGTPSEPVAEPGWLDSWRRAAATELGRSGPAAVLAGGVPNPRLGDAWAARSAQLVTEHSASVGVPLFVGASQVIRWADLLAPCPVEAPGAPVFASRGLAGIDGSIATAQGLALALGAGGRRPMRALMGDLTFWHDVGSLNAGVLEASPDLQVVAINDSGGSIFGRLEHGQPHLAGHFERLFAVAQRGSITGVAAGFGVDAVRVEPGDEAGLREALAAPISGISVVEVVAGR